MRYSFGDHKGCSFTYPGALPGWGPSSNNHLAYTINFLFPAVTTIDSRGNPVVGEVTSLASREMRFSRTSEEVVRKMRLSNLVIGQNVNVADANFTFTMEVAPHGIANLKVIGDKLYFHGNNYQRIPLDKEDPRIRSFLQHSEDSALEHLSRTDGDHPIFRKCPDDFVTIFTCQFAVDDAGCMCKFWDHSGDGPPPVDKRHFFEIYIPFETTKKRK